MRRRRCRRIPGLLAGGVVLVGVAVAAGRAGGGEVAVRHLQRPDATLPPGLPGSARNLATPFTFTAPGPGAAAVAALLVVPQAGGPARGLAGLGGRRGTLVAFYASWCDACRDELPALAQREARLRAQGVGLVLVDLDESAATARDFLRDRDVSVPGYLDARGAAHDGLGLVGLPSSALLAADGAVVARLEGWRGAADLDAALGDLGISP